MTSSPTHFNNAFVVKKCTFTSRLSSRMSLLRMTSLCALLALTHFFGMYHLLGHLFWTNPPLPLPLSLTNARLVSMFLCLCLGLFGLYLWQLTITGLGFP
ncbi:Uncharacterized protein TCM_040006 [Theobroma cacao]|uniref:Uncharacterized protein n=1 Tax=Theobroma cacao TaxID=3641 RepID=A0A061GSA4_THECC|nr:Uncharacterized protein TCM_040006 [Theobroma cacao]